MRDSEILIEDSFSGRGEHIFELHYHLHPDAFPFPDAGGWLIQHGEERIHIRLKEGGDFHPAKGEKEPILGWYSPRYGLKQETAVLRCTQKAEIAEVYFATIIRILPPGGVCIISHSQSSGNDLEPITELNFKNGHGAGFK